MRAELERLGYEFATHCDTEVIVYAWDAWGEACVERFNGMFAFAVWDRGRQTLFLARDRLGVKPLYYAETADGELLFASELKALTEHPRLPPAHRAAGRRGLLRLRLRARAQDDLRGRLEAAARPTA